MATCQQACEESLSGGDCLAIFQQDGIFHLMIAELSGNRYLADMLRRLEIKVLLCRMLCCRSPEKVRTSVMFHRQILQAINNHNRSRATTLLSRHIYGTLDE